MQFTRTLFALHKADGFSQLLGFFVLFACWLVGFVVLVWIFSIRYF